MPVTVIMAESIKDLQDELCWVIEPVAEGISTLILPKIVDEEFVLNLQR